MAESRIKRHARLRRDGRLLWVGDDADWGIMRSTPRPELVCPQPGCGDLVHAVRNERGTRFLRRTRSGGDAAGECDHWWVAGSGGGPESQRHQWIKARLASICLSLGWAAIPEDPNTHADVWVPDARAALEVQLRRTDALARTHARFSAGAQTVVWFVAPDAPAAATLFGAPAVRFDVVAAGDAGRSVQPWDDAGVAARLVVFGTVWRWQEWRLTTGRQSAFAFLADVLAGGTVWCPPGTPGLPHRRSGWIRWADLALALGMPGGSPSQIRSMLPLTGQQWVAAQLSQRKRRPPADNGRRDR